MTALTALAGGIYMLDYASDHKDELYVIFNTINDVQEILLVISSAERQALGQVQSETAYETFYTSLESAKQQINLLNSEFDNFSNSADLISSFLQCWIT